MFVSLLPPEQHLVKECDCFAHLIDTVLRVRFLQLPPYLGLNRKYVLPLQKCDTNILINRLKFMHSQQPSDLDHECRNLHLKLDDFIGDILALLVGLKIM